MKKQPTFRLWLHCAIFLLSYSSLQAQWEYIGSPETARVHQITTHGDTLLVATEAGIFFSDNNAVSWKSIPVPDSTFAFREVWMEDQTVFFTTLTVILPFAYTTEIYRSSDWGVSWKNITQTLNEQNTGIRFFHSGDSLIWFGQLETLISTDKGDTYDIAGSELSGFKFGFTHESDLYFYTYDGLLIRIDDLSASWDTVGVFTDSLYISSISLIGSTLWKTGLDWLHDSAVISYSPDFGESWITAANLPFKASNITSIVGDEDHLFLINPNSPFLYFSGNHGQTWEAFNVPEKVISIVFFQDNLLLATSFGMFKSQDNGSTYTKCNVGLEASSAIALFPSGSSLWLNDDGRMFKKQASGDIWESVDGVQNLETTLNGHMVAYVDGQPHRSADGGTTWILIPEDASPVGFFPSGRFKSSGNIFYINSEHTPLYSLDYGASWQKIESDNYAITGVRLAYYFDKHMIITFHDGLFISYDGLEWIDLNYNLESINKTFINRFHYLAPYYFASGSAELFRLHEDSTIWIKLNNPVPGTLQQGSPYHRDYHFESHDNILYTTYYKYGVFASTDYGVSWNNISYGLNDLQTNLLKKINTELYLGVEGGVWRRDLSESALSVEYSGTVFNDLNSNGVREDGENGLPDVLIRKKNLVSFTASDANGDYSMFSDNIQYDSLEVIPHSRYALITTSPVGVTVQEDSLDFGLYMPPGIYDAAVCITGNPVFRPGFVSTITLTYKNNGTETTDMEIKLALPEELIYSFSSPEATFIGDTLTWIIKDVPPLSSGNITIEVYTDESVPIGTPIIIYAFTDVTNDGDANQQDNEAYLTVLVVGSIDPNDKAVFPSGNISPVMIADTQRLEYTIRFQNTGTFPASFVRIQDTLSSHLDLTTLEILSASHPYAWKMLPQNVLDVFFDDINLPDSTNDERGSHGFVKFAINAKTSLQLADKIENKAYIYFDYNLPVITNTVGSTVGFETGIKEPGNKLTLTVSPIPTKDYIMVTVRESVSDGEVVLSLYDTKGALVKTKTSVSPENIQLDIRDLPSGVYYLHARIGHDHGTISVLKN